ncbi:MAG: putative toxin-antitoxin system toxin component, PIN family [Desulfobacterales bacterium]|nr:putative toxin-antitoxin system toxin component, PIN family [Desulfobacterales bacterium]
MKIILDTNVLVSGIFFTGPPHLILEAWRRGVFQIILSGDIILEYLRVSDELAQRFSGLDVQPILELLIGRSDIVDPEPLPGPICDDPDDDKFFAAALSSGAKIIVSGDRHLLKVSGYRSITVLRPKAFADRYL